MKKTLSMLIVLSMLIAILPLTVLAYEIGKVELSATEPTAGKTPDFNVTCVDANNQNLYRIDTADKTTGSVNGVKWYNNTDQKYMSASDRFEEAKEYTLTVRLEPNTGHKFALDTGVGIRTAVSSYVNGKSATTSLAGDTSLEIYISKTYSISEKITSVEVTDITAPVAGQKPEYDGKAGDTGYQLKSGTFGNFKNGIYWYDLTDSKLVGANDTFISGHKYRVFLCLVPNGDNYEFRTDFNGNPLLTAYVNTNSAKAMKYMSEPASSIVSVYYDFPACSNPTVSSVVIENLPTPQAGKAPEYVATIASNGVKLAPVNNTFTKNGICWSHKTKSFDLTTTSFFFSDNTYVATLRLDVQSGYTLDKNITATVNGNAATASISGGQVIVKYEIKCPEYKISKVDITGVTPPAIGNTPSDEMQCADPNLYVVKNISWRVDDKLMSDSDKFIAGKNYDLEVYVDPRQDGWDYVAYFADKVAVTVNGKAVSEKKVERLGNSVKFVYTFTAAAASKIGTVNITGIDAPVAGKSPDYTATLPNSDTYTLDTSRTDKNTSKGVTWRNVTDNRVMTVGIDKFEKGNVYEIMVTVTPHNGYTFVTKSDGTPDVVGTINGKTATDIMGRSEHEAIIVYKFPVTPAATDNTQENQNNQQTPEQTSPQAPAQPSTGANGSGNGGTSKITFIDVPASAYFYEPVMWAAAEGITGGTSATTFSPNTSCTRAQVVTFLHRMVASPEPAAIANPFIDVASGVYYYKPVMWAVGSKITGGTSATTFSPDASCTRAQVVTFLWRCAGQPKAAAAKNPFADVKAGSYYYDAVLWAVEQGITGGTSATTFSPDASCTRAQVVTFLYRFINN